MTATADWIDDLERKAKAAIPGPWVADHSEEDNSAVKQEGRSWWDGLAFCGRPADAEFIAAANPAAILRLIEDNQRMRHGSLCPECNAKAWGERADLRRERDELAARLATVKDLTVEIVKTLADAGLIATAYISPDDTTKEAP